MAFDQSKISTLTMQLMAELDDAYGEDCEFGDILIITEVVGPNLSHIRLRASSPRNHVNLGLVRYVDKMIQPEPA